MHRNPRKTCRPAGLTLVEMMVAVAITVGLLLITGLIFTAATGASGKAMAHNEVMAQVAALTEQLERDFKGLRADMPLAIIFQSADPADPTSPRMDRIVFFANGDFQDISGTVSGNLARVFYGQSANDYDTPADADYPGVPRRRVLARREKIMVGDPTVETPTTYYWAAATPEDYDAQADEYAPVSFWRAVPAADFENYYFVDPSDNREPLSLIRRVDFSHPDTDVQGMYFLPDVTDFKIDVWFAGVGQWISWPGPLALYWNAPALKVGGIDQIDGIWWWYADEVFRPPHWLALAYGTTDPWPKALRFTFTVHDRHRRHYPEGLTFSYIVKLPERE